MKKINVFVLYVYGCSEELLEAIGAVRKGFDAIGALVQRVVFDEKNLALPKKEENSDKEPPTLFQKMGEEFAAISGGCDMLFILQASACNCKDVSARVEYCTARYIPVVVATKKGIENACLSGAGVHEFFWASPEELREKICEYAKA